MELKNEWVNLVKETISDAKISQAGLPAVALAEAGDYYESVVDEIIHKEAVDNERRIDGRKLDEVRPLYAEAGGVSPLLHGTGIFYRGGTHILSILTLGGPKDAQIVEGMEVQTFKRFMHHYNFPPFSTGETGRVGSPNRRAIGHGALAEKALAPVLPSKEDFPYTIRIVSEAMASNGSTSMGSVCASTLALMDGGVPIKTPVAGIAMGLMLDNSKDQGNVVQNDFPSLTGSLEQHSLGLNYKILTDIQGPEDHHGDMDFKIAGTRNGITALQLDIKVSGIPIAILIETLEKAKTARLTILDTITQAINKPRETVSNSAPKIIKLKIDTDQIGSVIGPGGKIINGIIKDTGAEIDIEEDGTVYVMGKNDKAEKAAKRVKEITHEYKAGERYAGEVVRILDFGAFVKISPYAEGLVHISELAPVRIEKVSDLLKIGDRVPVVVKEVDEKNRINLSIKRVNPDFFKGKIPQQNNNNRAFSYSTKQKVNISHKSSPHLPR